MGQKIAEDQGGEHMQTMGESQPQTGTENKLGEYIGAALAVIIALILLSGGATLAGLLGLGPIGAFWFGVIVTILIFAGVLWIVFFLLWIAHFSGLSRFI